MKASLLFMILDIGCSKTVFKVFKVKLYVKKTHELEDCIIIYNFQIQNIDGLSTVKWFPKLHTKLATVCCGYYLGLFMLCVSWSS